MVDWRTHRDLLQCNPKFNGSPRYDCIMVKTADKPFFHLLVYVFTCWLVAQFPLPLFILMMSILPVLVKGEMTTLDYGVCKPNLAHLQDISVWSIIRELLLPMILKWLGLFVIHTVDTDIFLRVKALQVQSFWGKPFSIYLALSCTKHVW